MKTAINKMVSFLSDNRHKIRLTYVYAMCISIGLSSSLVLLADICHMNLCDCEYMASLITKV